jgi:hypothetical protein
MSRNIIFVLKCILGKYVVRMQPGSGSFDISGIEPLCSDTIGLHASLLAIYLL